MEHRDKQFLKEISKDINRIYLNILSMQASTINNIALANELKRLKEKIDTFE